MVPPVEWIACDGALVALVIRAGFQREGLEFFTPGHFSQQVAYMNRPAGYRIHPHTHREVHRDVSLTQEALFVRKGKVRVDLFDGACRPIGSRILETGDLILLASGGHGVEMIEPTEILEVKQGPFTGDQDKVGIEPVSHGGEGA